MITLWGVWDKDSEKFIGPVSWFYRKEEAEHCAALMPNCEAREYGQFIQVPPEVVEAAQGWTNRNSYWLANDERTILNWAIAALTKGQGDG